MASPSVNTDFLRSSFSRTPAPWCRECKSFAWAFDLCWALLGRSDDFVISWLGRKDGFAISLLGEKDDFVKDFSWYDEGEYTSERSWLILHRGGACGKWGGECFRRLDKTELWAKLFGLNNGSWGLEAISIRCKDGTTWLEPREPVDAVEIVGEEWFIKLEIVPTASCKTFSEDMNSFRSSIAIELTIVPNNSSSFCTFTGSSALDLSRRSNGGTELDTKDWNGGNRGAPRFSWHSKEIFGIIACLFVVDLSLSYRGTPGSLTLNLDTIKAVHKF